MKNRTIYQLTSHVVVDKSQGSKLAFKGWSAINNLCFASQQKCWATQSSQQFFQF